MMDDGVDRAAAEPAQTTRHASLEAHAAPDDRMLKAFFDQSATGFAILDRDFKYVRVNAAFAQHLGAVAGRFPGRSYGDAGGDCADTLRVLTEVAHTKQALRVAARPEFRALNPTVANLDWMVEPLLDQDGELEWLVLSSIDVTELKRAELELRQRESLYHAVVTAMDEGVVGVVTYRRDITERKRAEQEQQRLNRALRLVTKCNQLLVHADDESRFLRAVCQLIVTDGGYQAASVRDPNTNDVRCRVERSERDPADPDQVGARSKPGSEGTSKIPASRPERAPELGSERARQGAAGSYIDIPLASGDRDDGGLTIHSAAAGASSDDRISGDYGVLTIHSTDPDPFSRDEVALLDELGGDVAYGIRTLRMRLNHRAVAEQLAFLAYHDPLTKLPNRRLLRERFERAAANADRAGDRVAVLFLDLDSFKEINDGLGHDVGDTLLVRIAERLHKNVRQTDTVSREGGDEFAVLLAGMPDVHAIARIAQTLLGAIAEPFDIDLNALTTSLSIGISVYPNDGRAFDTLRNQADTALHHAKESGRNAYRFFSNQMSADSIARTQMQLQLREALKRGEFYLCYQPQICLRDGRITAVEALLRWQRSDLETLLPEKFIPIAERSGLIIPIGDWVLNEACRQAVAWRLAGLADLIVAVNVSALQVRRGDLAGVVTAALERSGLPASSLELELTESILLQDTELTISTLQALHTLGVRFAIDDFGTGYSSLSYLKRLAVSKLKIDRSFTSTLSESAGDAAIVKAVIQLGHTMQLEVVAEGVETADQLGFLKDSGCDQAQGSLFSVPVSAADVPGLFTANN